MASFQNKLETLYSQMNNLENEYKPLFEELTASIEHHQYLLAQTQDEYSLCQNLKKIPVTADLLINEITRLNDIIHTLVDEWAELWYSYDGRRSDLKKEIVLTRHQLMFNNVLKECMSKMTIV